MRRATSEDGSTQPRNGETDQSGGKRSGHSWAGRFRRQSNKSKHSENEAEREPLLGESRERDLESGQDPESTTPEPTTKASPRQFAARVKDQVQDGAQKMSTALTNNWRYFVLACVLAGLGLILGLSIAHLVERSKRLRHNTVCLTPACVHAASEILYSLDPNYEDVDPCDDFDKYVCGGWQQRHDMRPDQGSISTASLMDETSKAFLRHILEDNAATNPSITVPAEDGDKENFSKLKDSYDACMDQTQTKKLGLEPLIHVVKDIKARFPVEKDDAAGESIIASKQKDHLSDVMISLATVGVSALISLDVSADDRYPDDNVLKIAPPSSPGLPSIEYYADEKIVKAYTDVAEKVLRNFITVSNGSSVSGPGSSVSYDYVQSLVASIVTFEKRLAQVTPTTQEQQDVTYYYNPMSLHETQSMLPQIAFDKVISSLTPDGRVPDRVIVASPTYMKNISRILDDTPVDVVQMFLTWKTIQQYSSAVDNPALKPLKQFDNIIRGRDPDAEPERWKTCIGVVDDQVGWILSKYFVEAAFSLQSKKLGEQVIADIKTSFINTLTNSVWMSDSVKTRAIEKVAAIDVKVGYPTSNPDVTSAEALRDYYSDLKISNSSFFGNTVNSTAFGIKQMWGKLGKPVAKDEWDMTASTVNAYYDPPGNAIVFPAGIMQLPVFYDSTVPQYLVYGAFGSVSGHELSHAFDSTGRHYDQKGAYTDWWDNSTVAGFEEKAQCFIDQYGNFTVPGNDGKALNVNGRLTLGENIADAGGVAAAFSAWKRYEHSEPNQLLPGLDKLTKEQLFFVSYGSFWCGKIRKEAQIERIYTDPHAPDFARIKGTMANNKDFKEAFQCQSQEPICKLW